MTEVQGKRILVTGGNGFLGGHVLDRLRRAGCAHVYAPCRADFDLTRQDAIERLFAEVRPEVVIHLAAEVGGIGANQRNPGYFFYSNAMMGIQLIEAARVHGVEKTVVLGTICSYPRVTPVPFQEDYLWNGYPEEVTGPYGIAKKAILVQCQSYRQQYGMNAVFLFATNLYGPRDHFDPESSHVVPAIIRKCVDAKRGGASEVVLWGDGTATREFLYVEDAAEGILRATESYDKPEPVNLGTGRETSIRELAERITGILDFRGAIRWDAGKPNGQPRRCLDVTRAEREFGFRASTPLEEGLRRTIGWYLAAQHAAAAR